MAEKSNTITISYSLDQAANSCKADAQYKSQHVSQFGSTWAEAKANVIGKCKQIEALGDPPPDETVDLDQS